MVYVQFWSQPDDSDGVLFEVCSGALNREAAQHVDSERQELLRDHGFEIGGGAGNFHNAIKVENARDVRALAREAMAVLCKVLGYDGRQELTFHLSLESNSKLRHVFDDIAPDAESVARVFGPEDPALLRVGRGSRALLSHRGARRGAA